MSGERLLEADVEEIRTVDQPDCRLLGRLLGQLARRLNWSRRMVKSTPIGTDLVSVIKGKKATQ